MIDAFVTPIPSLISKPTAATTPTSTFPRITTTTTALQAEETSDEKKDESSKETPKPVESSSSSSDDSPSVPEAMQQEMANAPPPAVQQRKQLDPLIASLASPGPPPKEGTETRNVPFLGEIPVDGSLVVLVPAAAIAVIGFIMSIVVGFNARDEMVRTLESVNPPPPKAVVIDKDKCRGICSSQESDLDSMRSMMENLSKRKSYE